MNHRHWIAAIGYLLIASAALFVSGGASAQPSSTTIVDSPEEQAAAEHELESEGEKPKGISLEFEAVYTFQAVVSGGADGPVFDALSDEDDVGNTISARLGLEFDTEALGLWHGGYLNFVIEGRAGRSVVERAGTLSVVNNDAIYPNVVDDFDDETWAITDLSFTQYLNDWFAIYGGLLNTAEGDANEIAGSALSAQHFLNTSMLASPVEDATAPNVSLGGGLIFEPNESISGSVFVNGTAERAGENPFEDWNGTTFGSEWTFAYALGEWGGAQTVGFLYGINASRTDIATDPRRALAIVLAGGAIPTTSDDTWALYYNGHQYFDAQQRIGAFLRAGVSDGDPNPVQWHIAGGLGGRGFLPGRHEDRWGLGVFYVGMSDEDLLEGLGIDDEVGVEAFYNIAIVSFLNLTLDVQAIDSAVPDVDTAWVLGVRLGVSF